MLTRSIDTALPRQNQKGVEFSGIARTCKRILYAATATGIVVPGAYYFKAPESQRSAAIDKTRKAAYSQMTAKKQNVHEMQAQIVTYYDNLIGLKDPKDVGLADIANLASRLRLPENQKRVIDKLVAHAQQKSIKKKDDLSPEKIYAIIAKEIIEPVDGPEVAKKYQYAMSASAKEISDLRGYALVTMLVALGVALACIVSWYSKVENSGHTPDEIHTTKGKI